ncbi:hypothetical protein SRHO_G00140730 [Serrasalmus rhombeus]
MEAQNPDHSGSIQASITAQTGGTAFAPVIDGNTVQGSLTVINNIYRAQETSTLSSSSVQAGGSPDAFALTEEYITVCKQTHKSELEKTYRSMNEGLSHDGNSTLLNKIYTELYITEGGSGEVNNEHEVRRIQKTSKRQPKQERPIKCNDIFKPIPGKDKPIRTVLTRGIAGIGKTVSVQKFILDWVEEKANQDVTFIFPFSFRELNLIKDKKLSLMDLLHLFFPQIKQFRLIDLIHCADCKFMFILDGLDECRPPLDLEKGDILSDLKESASVDVLLTNLIRGKLLSSSLLWITTRPAAVNQILLQYINQVTEIRGFSDPQKEEYFRKRISDQKLAKEIITHIKSSRSLYIMCHIPVFCWISATVLEEMLTEAESEEIPRTLTQMFIYFLNFQIKHSSQKYRGKSDIDPLQTREIILALGKLAFQQLESGNIIFYEEDLRECGIDVREMSVYSGVCTQIFREESALHLGKVFTFVHLSVQEFLSALYAFFTFIYNNKNVLLDQAIGFLVSFRRSGIFEFLRCAVDKALQSENGNLDLFLRFLLGLSLESSQTLLRRLLPQTRKSLHSKEPIIRYIKKKIRENPSAEKSINLFHCLNELNDHSLVQEVQMYLNRRDGSGFSGAKLSPAQWSALVFVLLNSEEELDEFDLRKYDPSEECLLKLLPVVKASRKAVLEHCSITSEGCADLVKALKSSPSHLRELNLSHNYPGDLGVKELSDLLKDPHCQLQKLQLYNCSITGKGCAALVKALKSNPSHLRELDLGGNKPGASAVKKLSDLLKDPHCKLEKLQLSDCSITEECCAALVKALKSKPSLLRELNLNFNKPGDSAVKELSELLKDSHYKLETLQLAWCSITGKGCADLVNALKLNPSSQLKELHLSGNKLEDSGAKELSGLLEDPHCKLEKLQLERCSIKEEGCADLIKALKSNPSHLRELNLSVNKVGDSGLKELSDLLKDSHCKLEKLQLADCSITGEGCADLIISLKSNPSYVRELNLSDNNPGDSAVKELSDLLEDSHCKLEKLQLKYCSITHEGCAALVKALKSNPSHLRELNLNNNNPGESAVKEISDLLEDPHCKLEKILVAWCSITDEGCADLFKALKSNPSHVKELDLSVNKPGDTGLKELSDLLKDPYCKLEKLQLQHCSITEEGCADLVKALKSNPSYLRQLNLSWNKLGDLGVKELSDLLKDPHCKLEKLQLINCNIRGERCATLVKALKSNPSTQLRELNLSINKPGDSGVKELSDLLKDPHCKLEILQLACCNIRYKHCDTLVKALKSNPSSQLTELSLSCSKQGDSAVKELCNLLKDQHCQLEKLRLAECYISDKGCSNLVKALKSNPSSKLTELNLNRNELGDSGMKELAYLLKDPYCKLEKLQLADFSITHEGCAALAKALKSNPSSHLRELNLCWNESRESVKKELSDLLKDPHYKLEELTIREPHKRDWL